MGERLKESTWFEIFKAGTWHGHVYTKDDLDKMVENFEKGDPRVPLIIGHNGFFSGEEKPAHGWVEKLKRSGNRLLAKARNVSAELVEAVNEEIYPMRSVELWHNYHDQGLALGAIAFLGGSNPEVGGMADFQFCAGAGNQPAYAREIEGRSCFAFSSNEKMIAESSDQKKSQHHYTEGGDSTMTKEEIQKAIADGIAEGISQFKSGPEFTQLQAENQRLATEVADARNFAAIAAVKADITTCETFAKGLLDAKKITPAQFQGGLSGFLASLDNVDKVEFSAGKPQTRREFAMELLNNQPATGASLFASVDNPAARPGEDDNIPADVSKFAAKHNLDPKIVAAQFAAQRRAFSATTSAEDDGAVMGVSASIGAAAAK